MAWLFGWLVPRIRIEQVPIMICLTVAGAVLAGMYGVLHDLVTFSISPEYFTKLKFDQFRYADFGFGDQVFAGTIGFLASWWVGGLAAWFLARRLVPQQPAGRAVRQVLQGFLCVFVLTLLCGGIAYFAGIARGPNADYSNWAHMIQVLDIQDEWSFIRVAYIHSGSYMGGLLGLLSALIIIRPESTSVARSEKSTKVVQE
ncbi:hypothetical protein C5Y96_08420 [Blastopirellula marina]|uniref:Uncharacterized protein n=1 Tax=Blastopirellula marina TaxID=124 RepID=A0A2S8FU50_9BACT|nr:MULTISPECIES: hypothetical protein [Pirellulaceae]PQO35673.1 hypothetical protein C5Y96_08420 [Blastopirellula marina]RCS53247.1 hypothetical protein DTL36_08430 [Bremerella cremea]